MKRAKIDYKAIALLKISRDQYMKADEYFEALCEHLKVPEDWKPNMWDYIIDDNTSIPNIKKEIDDWKRIDAKNNKKNKVKK